MAKKYIDAERFVEYFGDWYTEEGTEIGYVGPIKDLVFRMPAADIEPRWIPVTERLPEEDYETGNGVQFSADVLITLVNHGADDERFVVVSKTVDGNWYNYAFTDEWKHSFPNWCEVIAWMPLPTPYKGGEEE